MALEAADVIEPPLLVDAHSQGLDPQIEGHYLPRLWLGFGSLIHEGGVIVPTGIPADGYLPKAAGRHRSLAWEGTLGKRLRCTWPPVGRISFLPSKRR
jgi:hypothetical protein